MEIILPLLIIAHGLIYILYFVPNNDEKYPFTFNKGPLANRPQAVKLARALIIAAVVGFVVSGLTMLFASDATNLWHTTLALSALIVIGIQIAFWQNQLFLGFFINVFLLYLVFFTAWP